jgi:hypothetical protein
VALRKRMLRLLCHGAASAWMPFNISIPAI